MPSRTVLSTSCNRQIASATGIFKAGSVRSDPDGSLPRRAKLFDPEPDASDGSLWESNGPVYNGRAIRMTFEMTLCVYAISYLLAKIGRPSLVVPKESLIVFELDWLPGHQKVAKAFDQMWANG